MTELFTTKKINPKITRISGCTGEMMYLVTGSKKALLIDSGLGIGSLRNVVDQLTDLPLTVVLSHGHIDHAMGASLFADKQVWLSPADQPLAQKQSSLDLRRMYYQRFHPNQSIADTELVSYQNLPYHPLTAGTVFDLGDEYCEVYALAGHTAGSMVILLVNQRILFTGDACNPSVFLFLPESLSVTTYYQQLTALIPKVAGRFDSVLYSHGLGSGPADMLNSAFQLCVDIINRKTDDISYRFLNQDALIAKKMDHHTHLRVDNGSANIIYDPAKI